MELPESCMSRISVSMGVLPTRRMKKSWEMRLAGTARRAGRRSSKRPKRWGWLGYCILSYSVRATWAFSCRDSTWAGSVRPHASVKQTKCIISWYVSVDFLFHTLLLHNWRGEFVNFVKYLQNSTAREKYSWQHLTRVTATYCTLARLCCGYLPLAQLPANFNRYHCQTTKTAVPVLLIITFFECFKLKFWLYLKNCNFKINAFLTFKDYAASVVCLSLVQRTGHKGKQLACSV